MSQSLTVKAEKNPFLDPNIPTRLVLDWKSAGAGTVSLAIASTLTTQNIATGVAAVPQPSKIQGVFLSCQTAPGVNGDLTTSLPTAYTLALLDAYGNDLLNNAAVTTPRSASVSEVILKGAGKTVVDSDLTVTITGAGSGTYGRIILELEDIGYGKL